MLFNKPVAFSSNQIAYKSVGLLGRCAGLGWWAHPYVSHGSAGCSNGSSLVMDLAGLTNCPVGCQLVWDSLNWDEERGRGAMCVILWRASPGMSSWLRWRVKSNPVWQCFPGLCLHRACWYFTGPESEGLADDRPEELGDINLPYTLKKERATK